MNMEDPSILNESDHSELIRIIKSNHYIRTIVQDQTKGFLILKSDLLKNIQNQQMNQSIIIQNNQILFDSTQIELLNEQVITPKIQLALVGANSCGKTSFLHFLLRSGNFLPTDVGPVSARIIHLTYADAENAVLHVYQSMNDKQIHEQVSLSEFFSNKQEPDWDGMKNALKNHVTRPDAKNIKPDSDEFAQWAKFSIEIQIPSSFLKLGIDIYDTPGLIFSDVPALKDNLCELVRLDKPTLVFMYDNASVSSDTKDCFLALKDALGPLTDASMFFLNTKVDIDRILIDADPNDQGIEDDKLPEIILNERQRRYQLLLEVPSMSSEFPGGLPKSLSQCPCFDIVSVHSDFDELGCQFNQTTLNRLIQFAANSNLKIARNVSQLVLPMIDAFFDFALTTNHRTVQQFQLILNEALQWTENYYRKYRSLLENLLTELYNNILEKLNHEIDNIAERASKFETVILIEKYIKTVVQHEIIKVEIEKVSKKYTDIALLDQCTNVSFLTIAQKNEFLIAAQRTSDWFFQFDKKRIDNKSSREEFTVQTILVQILLITDILTESNEKEKGSTSLSNYHQLFPKKSSSSEKGMSLLDITKNRLSEMSLWLIDQQRYINILVDQCYFVEKREFIKKLNQYYHLAIQTLSNRDKLYHLVGKYSLNFASIQCKIIAALNLAKFNGKRPIIDEDRHLVEWMNEKNFLIKKTTDYLEVHYHLKITQLRIPNILSLLYLYKDKDSDNLWMFFSNYSKKLTDVKCTIDNLFEICFDIAYALSHLHLNEIIHGNIQIDNIFLDENNQCYLANFYFKKENQVKMSDDIKAFGQLGLVLCECITKDNMSLSEEDSQSIKEFRIFFIKCLSSDVKNRPKAALIVQKLKEIRRNL